MFSFFKRKKNTEPTVEEQNQTTQQNSVVEDNATAIQQAESEQQVTATVTTEHAKPVSAPVSEEEETESTVEIVPTEVVTEPVITVTPAQPLDEILQADGAESAPVSADSTDQSSMSAGKLGWATRLKQGLSKSRNQMAKSLASVFGGGQIDEDLYEELETVLLTSDMGIEATEKLLAQVRQRVSLKGLKNGDQLRSALKEALYELLLPLQQPLVLTPEVKPFVIMMAGVNGAGKTTSIGKLAKYFQSQGKSVLLAAGDTFRAAAREQLQQWGERNNVTVIAQESGDSAAVCFDAMEAAKARGIDVVLADTAGRLPTQLHLMEEIKKVKRVIQKSMPEAPHEVMLVLDANVGQNAINQVVAFDDALGLTGLIVSKLDGTAKGGILAALAAKRPIPVRFIGVGEGIDDLRPFDARAFVDALIEDE